MRTAACAITLALLLTSAVLPIPATADSGPGSSGPGGGGGGTGACTFSEDEVFLVNCGVIPAAVGKRRVRTREDCNQDLRVEIQNVPRKTSYTVFVDGVNRGIIKVGAFGQGQIEFSTDADQPGELPLNFDPFGHIDIAAKKAVILSLGSCAGH